MDICFIKHIFQRTFVPQAICSELMPCETKVFCGTKCNVLVRTVRTLPIHYLCVVMFRAISESLIKRCDNLLAAAFVMVFIIIV